MLAYIHTEQIRIAYKPEKIRILFIGESIPAGGTFFYNANSNLFRYTMEAFSEAFSKDFINGCDFLCFFKEKGCYLDDLCPIPVNNMAMAHRRSIRADNVLYLAQRLRKYQPGIIISVMKAIEEYVGRAIVNAKLTDSVFYTLPFPAQGHQRVFVEELISIIIKNIR